MNGIIHNQNLSYTEMIMQFSKCQQQFVSGRNVFQQMKLQQSVVQKQGNTCLHFSQHKNSKMDHN